MSLFTHLEIIDTNNKRFMSSIHCAQLGHGAFQLFRGGQFNLSLLTIYAFALYRDKIQLQIIYSGIRFLHAVCTISYDFTVYFIVYCSSLFNSVAYLLYFIVSSACLPD